MQAEHSELITKKLPLDSEGFTFSFKAHSYDPEAVAQFYRTYGLVIFDEVLLGGEVELSVQDLWAEVAEMTRGEARREDPSSWVFRGGLQNYGFVGNRATNRPQFWKNRCNPTVYALFKRLYGLAAGEAVQEPLLCLFDRGSLLRPGRVNKSWITSSLYHFDIDPWAWTRQLPDELWRRDNRYGPSFKSWLGEGCYVPQVRNFTKLQGVLALSPTGPSSGGFECVPGFHNYIGEWCAKTPSGTYIEHSPELMANMQKCYQRAGSLLIFSRELPHNIYPNKSEQCRYAQYLRMAPESTLMLTHEEKQLRKQAVREMLPQGLDTSSAICREIFMLDEQ